MRALAAAGSLSAEDAVMKGTDTIITKIQSEIITPLVFLLFAVAVLLFLWGIVNYIAKGASEEQRSMGRKHMIWGSVGMAIMLAVQGIVQFIENSINNF